MLVTGSAGPAGVRLAGTRRSRTWPVAGANRAAGNAMASDWWGRSALYSVRHVSTRGLGVLDALEGLVLVQQLQLQGLVQALDLARGRGRAGPGQPLGDAVLAADPLEQHLGRAGLAEPAGEHHAVEFLTDVKYFSWWS